MRLRAELTTYKDSLEFLGYDVNNGKCKIRVFVFLLLYTCVVINTLYFVNENWKKIDERIKGLKAITFYTLVTSYALVLIFRWSDTKLALDLIYEEKYKFPYRITNDRIQMMKEIHEDMIQQNSFWRNAVLGYSVVVGLLPLFTFTKVSLPFPIYYPKNHQNTFTFLVGYFMQTFLVLQLLQYGYVGTSTVASMQVVEGELKLLTLSVKEMDKQIVFVNKGLENLTTKLYGGCETSPSRDKQFIAMKEFLKYFVKHHQDIYRKLKDIVIGIQGEAFILNFGASIYVCMAVYNISQKKDILWKAQEVLESTLWLYDIYCMDYIAEQIYTADDNLRNTLYECSWVDKPGYFKKSLQIIMTRLNRTIQVQPVGLFVLSLKNYAACINAAYSYYNLLNGKKNV